jgi:predicted dehydrogenase
VSLNYDVLIIGCGNIAGGFDMGRSPDLLPLTHAGAYLRHGGFQLAACVDPEIERRKAFAQHWAIPNQVANLDELDITSGSIDVVSVCSPTHLHRQHVEQALALQPRVIFCEKPLAPDVADVKDLIQQCQSRGVHLIVNYNRQWDQSLSALVDEIRSGHWGKVRSVVGHYNKGLLNNGSHMVELLLRLVGPLELVTTSSLNYDFWESDPTAAVLLTADKAQIPVYLSPGNAQDFAYFELELICEKGVIRMVSGGMGWQYRDVIPDSMFSGYRSLDKTRYGEGRYLETMSRAVDDIYTYLKTGKSAENRNERLLAVQELCARIQRHALAKQSQHRQ